MFNHVKILAVSTIMAGSVVLAAAPASAAVFTYDVNFPNMKGAQVLKIDNDKGQATITGPVAQILS